MLRRCHGIAQQRRVALRRDGKALLVIPGAEATIARIETQADLALLQDGAIGLAEHRQQHLADEIGPAGTPVDVEEFRIGREPAPLQHVEPPGIVVADDAHVIRNEIEHQTQAAMLQPVGERVQLFDRADLGIDLIVVDDVVAMSSSPAAP